MKQYNTFTFEEYMLDAEQRIARFTYSLDDELYFTESLRFPGNEPIQLNPLIDSVLFNLHLILGISYWKAFCAPHLVIKSGSLTKEQAAFWETAYRKGLGQFFFENTIDSRELIHFPSSATTARAHTLNTSPEAVIALGGGKDSLVTLSLLRSMKKPFQTFTLGTYPLITDQINHLQIEHTTVERRIDPQLFELNKHGALNGHVPISIIYMFTALLTAAIGKKKYVIFSNERSANEGNVEYLGETINHQWSKTFEFEQMFQHYVREFITPDIVPFSLLRPLSELHIARLFAHQTDFLPLFSSCNRNFALLKDRSQRWCGECPKCVFVFTMLAPFVEQHILETTFGKNILADDALLPLVKELLGVEKFKPFECVGTAEEVSVAMYLIAEKGGYESSLIMKYFVEQLLPQIDDMPESIEHTFTPSQEHAIPQPFQPYLHAL